MLELYNRNLVLSSLFGCLACLTVASVIHAEGRVFLLDLRNSSDHQGFGGAERACATQDARLASAEELRHAVVECSFSACTRGWLHGGTMGTTVCNNVGSVLKAVDVKTENATEDTAHLDAFCIKDKDVPCGDPPSFPNTRLQGHTGFEMGDELLYTCVPGYVMPSGHNAFSLLCDSCGEWYGLVQLCVKDDAETHVDYEDKFTDAYGEPEDHSEEERLEEAQGEVYEEVHEAAYPDEHRSQEQQEASFTVEGGEQHGEETEGEGEAGGEKLEEETEETGVEGEAGGEYEEETEETGGEGEAGGEYEEETEETEGEGEAGGEEEEEVVDVTGDPGDGLEKEEVAGTDTAKVTEAPVSQLSQKHLFWFPSEAFEEEGHPAPTQPPIVQTTPPEGDHVRTSGGQSEESKEDDSQEGHYQLPADSDHHDELDHDDSHHDDSHHDDHDDSHHDDHDDIDNHDDSHHDDSHHHDHDDSHHDDSDHDDHDDSHHDDHDGKDDSLRDNHDDHDDGHHDDHDDGHHDDHDDGQHDDHDDRVKHYIPAQREDEQGKDSHYKDSDEHDDHYDMGEHEDERDHVHHGSRGEHDDREEGYDDEGHDHDDVTEDHGEQLPDESEGHLDHGDHGDHDHDDGDGDQDGHEDDGDSYTDHDHHDNHDHDDHDHIDHDDDDDHDDDHVVVVMVTDEPQTITQGGAGAEPTPTTDDTWLDGYPVVPEESEKGGSTEERAGPEEQEEGLVVMVTDRPNEVEVSRPIPYTHLPEAPGFPTGEPGSEQGAVEEIWPGLTPTTSPSAVSPEPSESPLYPDSHDYDRRPLAPTRLWEESPTEHPFLDQGPAPTAHDGDIITGHTDQNLTGQAGERGEVEGEIGETICTGEDCPPPPPQSSGRGPTVAAIIVAICAVATAAVVGAWCYRRRQQKSSVYEMNGKGQSQSRHSQQIEMQQKV